MVISWSHTSLSALLTRKPTLVLHNTHLFKTSRFTIRGQLVPQGSSGEGKHLVREVLLVGKFHAPGGLSNELALIEGFLHLLLLTNVTNYDFSI